MEELKRRFDGYHLLQSQRKIGCQGDTKSMIGSKDIQLKMFVFGKVDAICPKTLKTQLRNSSVDRSRKGHDKISAIYFLVSSFISESTALRESGK